MYITPRFWSFVDKQPDGCWVWTGKRGGRGYGQASARRDDGKWVMVYAHRVAFEMERGPIPDGLLILHSCDNPPCVNPAHLTAGTQTDNLRQMKDRGRSGRVFTPDDVRAVRLDPRRPTVIAREYGCTPGAVRHIKHRRNWAWVPD